MKDIIQDVIERRIFKKIILSKCNDKTIIKTTGKLFENKAGAFLQLETLHSDGKATHRNIPLAQIPDIIAEMADNSYRQINLITTAGECQYKVSNKGKRTVINRIKPVGEIAEISSHNRDKNYILKNGVPYSFLYELGVSDIDGNVFDKKRSKFRQINKFLEIITDIADKLPKDKVTIWDLCCGKSYLTFAVYYYFSVVLGREVDMYGVDLKADVIEYCKEVAHKVGFKGLHFVSGDINSFSSPDSPDLVVSLHACDIATDIVLAKAVKSGAKVIMSSPCCQHEMMGQIDVKDGMLDFITEHSMLKQKLCVAATDALRLKRLEIEGYSVSAIEFIDPDETPKNLLIRGVKTQISENKKTALRDEYDRACEFLGVNPYLDKILN